MSLSKLVSQMICIKESVDLLSTHFFFRRVVRKTERNSPHQRYTPERMVARQEVADTLHDLHNWRLHGIPEVRRALFNIRGNDNIPAPIPHEAVVVIEEDVDNVPAPIPVEAVVENEEDVDDIPAPIPVKAVV